MFKMGSLVNVTATEFLRFGGGGWGVKLCIHVFQLIHKFLSIPSVPPEVDRQKYPDKQQRSSGKRLFTTFSRDRVATIDAPSFFFPPLKQTFMNL